MSFADGFWATVELLVALDATSQSYPFEDDVEDWLENVSSQVKMHMKQDEDPRKNEEDEESTCDDSIDYGNLVDCSFSYPPVRSRLELLMGTNVVRLTDRKYMLKLIARIRQDHEKNQDARIQDRKYRELMRTKKMILDRFIPVEEAPIEIRQYPLFQLYCYCDAIFEQRRKKPKLTRMKIRKSEYYQLLYPRKSSVDEVSDGEEEEVPMKEILVDGELQLVPLTQEEIDEASKDREVAEDIANGYMYTKEEYDNLHYEADSVKKLKETRTVNEMYARAYEIVGALTTFSSGEKRKRCTMDQPESTPASSTTSKTNVQVE